MSLALIRHLLQQLYDRIVQLLQAAPPGTLQVTGVVGLALLWGFYHARGGDNPNAGNNQQRPAARNVAAGSHGAAHGAGADAQGPSATDSRGAGAAAAAAKTQASKPAASQASNTPQGRAVAAQLAGLSRVTVSLPGVALAERSPAQLQEAASVLPEAVELLKEMSRVCRDLYLIAHVDDDVGEAVVTGALEAAGLLGTRPGQVRPQRLLFCGTIDGKVSIVRQLEPELHIDGHATTVDDLKRFMPQLLLVQPQPVAGTSAANVGVASSLRAFFGL